MSIKISKNIKEKGYHNSDVARPKISSENFKKQNTNLERWIQSGTLRLKWKNTDWNATII